MVMKTLRDETGFLELLQHIERDVIKHFLVKELTRLNYLEVVRDPIPEYCVRVDWHKVCGTELKTPQK